MAFLYFLPFVVLLVISITMFIQGWMVIHESYGYRENPKFKNHPELKGVRKGDRLMSVSFNESEIPEMDFSKLYERIQKQKMDELFSEPYDGDMEDEDL